MNHLEKLSKQQVSDYKGLQEHPLSYSLLLYGD